ncbi:MAG TPA: ATP synthase F1 subunit delta [archaeon]|nr:ATP synthase F1 subunit delta [archaeon]
MRTSSIAKEYAKALFLLARRSGKIDLIGEELEEFTRLVEKNKPVKNFLLAPQIGIEKKMKALEKALSGKVDNELFKFLMVLAERRRQEFLAEICAFYQEELDKYYNQLQVFVESAVGLTDTECETLASSLSRHLKRKIMVKSTVNPHLLGGLVCRIGDVVYDGSLRRRLERLSYQMLKAKI